MLGWKRFNLSMSVTPFFLYVPTWAMPSGTLTLNATWKRVNYSTLWPLRVNASLCRFNEFRHRVIVPCHSQFSAASHSFCNKKMRRKAQHIVIPVPIPSMGEAKSWRHCSCVVALSRMNIVSYKKENVFAWLFGVPHTGLVGGVKHFIGDKHPSHTVCALGLKVLNSYQLLSTKPWLYLLTPTELWSFSSFSLWM